MDKPEIETDGVMLCDGFPALSADVVNGGSSGQNVSFGSGVEDVLLRVVGVGAGGHTRVILDILKRTGGFEVVGFTTDGNDTHVSDIGGVPYLGGDAALPGVLSKGVSHAFIGIGGIGDNLPRARAYDRVISLGFRVIKAIHPSAVIAGDMRLGSGVTITAGAIVNPGARLGNDVIVNSGAIVASCPPSTACKGPEHSASANCARTAKLAALSASPRCRRWI